jgi:hypothetical protein
MAEQPLSPELLEADSIFSGLFMRLMATALLWATGIFPSHAEPLNFSPEAASFAYANAGFSESAAERQQSLSRILEQGTPAYVRNIAQDLRRSAAAAAMQVNLPIVFFINLIQQESSFQWFAVSRAGAVGIAQFMPTVATWRGLENPFEAEGALIEAARYLAELRNEFGNLGLAAAAYNAGPTRLRDYLQGRRVLPAETRHYVVAITGTEVDEWTKSDTHAISPTLAQDRKSNTRQISLPLPRAMPQPSQFAIGKPVRPNILASEKAALARHGWKIAASR